MKLQLLRFFNHGDETEPFPDLDRPPQPEELANILHYGMQIQKGDRVAIQHETDHLPWRVMFEEWRRFATDSGREVVLPVFRNLPEPRAPKYPVLEFTLVGIPGLGVSEEDVPPGVIREDLVRPGLVMKGEPLVSWQRILTAPETPVPNGDTTIMTAQFDGFYGIKG